MIVEWNSPLVILAVTGLFGIVGWFVRRDTIRRDESFKSLESAVDELRHEFEVWKLTYLGKHGELVNMINVMEYRVNDQLRRLSGLERGLHFIETKMDDDEEKS